MKGLSRLAALAALGFTLLPGLPAQAFPFYVHTPPLRCLTRPEIVHLMREQGYTDIALHAPTPTELQMRAHQRYWIYLVDLDYCDGHIEGLQNIGPIY